MTINSIGTIAAEIYILLKDLEKSESQKVLTAVAALCEVNIEQNPNSSKSSTTGKLRQEGPPGDNDVELSIREFVDKYEPKRNVDFISTFGLYLKEHRNQSTFTRKDLIGCFEDSGESVPANLTRDIDWAVTAGWIATKNSDKDHYYITQSGKIATYQKFPHELKKKTAITQKSTKKKQKAK